MKEIVVVSGKGGTGKTSLAACFAVLAGDVVVADCDVDAPDLHLLLSPRIVQRQEFRAGHLAVVDPGRCDACGACQAVCRFDAVLRADGDGTGPVRYTVDPAACEGCGVCVRVCGAGAIGLVERACGEWLVSETRCGHMVHARLDVGAENSGRLAATVRREGRRQAEAGDTGLLLVDGPPGIGCPVIASITGCDLVLAVGEPSLSGEHDLRRLLQLARHFQVPAALCVNKWDINPSLAERLEAVANGLGCRRVGRVRYDPGVTRAQQQALTAIEARTASAADIVAVWRAVLGLLDLPWPAGLAATGRGIAARTEMRGDDDIMRIAIPVSGGVLCQHFGHCQEFVLVDVDPQTRAVSGTRRLEPPPHEPGVLPRWLKQQGADLVIAGGMGARAQSLFVENGVRVMTGAAPEPPERLVAAYLAGTLVTGANACDH